jgi:hypothetical protein
MQIYELYKVVKFHVLCALLIILRKILKFYFTLFLYNRKRNSILKLIGIFLVSLI